MAAIALPGYQKAVGRSKFVQYISWARHIYQAEEEYRYANGEWTYDFLNLTLGLPGGTTYRNNGESIGVATLPDGQQFTLTISDSYKRVGFDYRGVGVFLYFETREMWCFFYTDLEKRKICESIRTEGTTSCMNVVGGSCLVQKLK